ncbi:MAG: LysE family translocator [Candidatus Niyogibacteria bacterium]|nr:LysE family translocator [Candidatus Niyogibacteria bacterium]
MIGIFWTNFILGFSVAAVIGPVNLTTMRRGLDGFWRGFLCMMGSVCAETIFLTLAVSGIILFFNDPAIMRWLWLSGGLAILYLAIKSWQERAPANLSESAVVGNPFIAGFLVDLLNPFCVVWWATVAGSFILSDLKDHSVWVVYGDSFGIVAGIAACLFILLCLAVWAKKHITEKIISKALKLSSVALLGFAIWFFHHFYLSWYV